MSEDNVIPFRKAPEVGSDEHLLKGLPQLVQDPATGLWGIIVDSVEVIAGLDPVGLREKIRISAGGGRNLSVVPSSEPNGKEQSDE